MKVETTSSNAASYNAPAEKVATTNKIKSSEQQRTRSIEIKNHMSQNMGYNPTMQEKLIIDAIERANQKVMGPNKEFEFAIHKETKQIMVKVLDSDTKEVIREIPPEKVLDAVAQMCELAGLFVDEKR